jgi:Xaa-Pro aminopeptidase
MPFMQNTDLFYLTGVNQEETVLILFPDTHEQKDREILFVKETSEQIAIWEGEKLTKEQATEVSGIKRVEWSDSFQSHLHRLAPEADTIYLTTNEHLRASTIVETRNDRFIKDCRGRYPLHQYERLAPLMHRLRVSKHPLEIEMLQKAIDITEAGFRRVLDFVKPGVGEWEVEAEYLHEFVKQRSRGFAYSPIIGAGKNACVLHYVENNCICQDGDLLLMDVAAEWANWNADMTRTIPVNGRFTDRQRDVYNAVLRVFRGACDILRPGMTPTEWRKQTIDLMEVELIGLGLIDEKAAKEQDPDDKTLVKKYFMHGVGHHLGLDVHDVHPPHEPVAEGMVFTVEPGIYIREEAMGVRLENDILIGKDQNIDLFANIPIEAEEIEELMNRPIPVQADGA